MRGRRRAIYASRLGSRSGAGWRAQIGWFLLFLVAICAAFGPPMGAFAASNDRSAAPGYDVSFPNCHGGLPAAPAGHVVVGVNGGRAFTQNPCFADEYRWATATGSTLSLYMNLNYPNGPGLDQAGNGPLGACAAADQACRAYTYGYNAARYADAYARASTSGGPRWWLDVETDNFWSPDTGLNARVIQGAVDYFKQNNLVVGIYSVLPMWRKIAGNYAPGLPIWVAQTRASTPTLAYCGPAYVFGGGTTVLVQHWNGVHDVDYVCPGQSLELPIAARAASVESNASSGQLNGGARAEYHFAYAGNNAWQTVTLDFGPHGADVANALFMRVLVGGVEVAKVHGTDTPAPGHLEARFSARAPGDVVVELTNYNPTDSTPVSYWIGH